VPLKGYESTVTSVILEVTNKQRPSFSQFAHEYARRISGEHPAVQSRSGLTRTLREFTGSLGDFLGNYEQPMSFKRRFDEGKTRNCFFVSRLDDGPPGSIRRAGDHELQRERSRSNAKGSRSQARFAPFRLIFDPTQLSMSLIRPKDTSQIKKGRKISRVSWRGPIGSARISLLIFSSRSASTRRAQGQLCRYLSMSPGFGPKANSLPHN